jgi:hypothetical protein
VIVRQQLLTDASPDKYVEHKIGFACRPLDNGRPPHEGIYVANYAT